MKILFVYPTFGIVHPDPPLGIASIAAVLRNNDIKVSIYDTSWNDSFDDLALEIKKYRPDIIGITSNTMNFNKSLKVASVVKNIDKNIKVCLGGPHPTAMPELTLKNQNVDYVVIGEGEVVFFNLLKYLEGKKDIGSINGLGYKIGDKLKISNQTSFIENLDALPLPARDLLPMEKYLRITPPIPLPAPSTSILTSRGCPFNCSFCQPLLRSLFGPKVRRRSPSNVLDEMEHLIEKYRIRSIDFQDDTMGYDKKWLEEFNREMKERDINIKWRCENRVDQSSPEVLKLMKDSGCINIVYGVESGSQRILDEVLRKMIKIEQTITAFKECSKLGITTRANFMIGSPTETRENIQESINLMKKIKPDMIMVHMTSPMMGSDLYKIAKEQDLLATENFDEFYRHNPRIMKHENLSSEELEKYLWRFRKEFMKDSINPIWWWKKRNYISLLPQRWKSILKIKKGERVRALNTIFKEILKVPIGYW